MPLTRHQAKVNTEWLKERRTKYPFLAEARTTLRPEVVDAELKIEHASAPRLTGFRTFMFKHHADRERFVAAYGKDHGAIRLPVE